MVSLPKCPHTAALLVRSDKVRRGRIVMIIMTTPGDAGDAK